MADDSRVPYEQALAVAERVKSLLQPHCHRVEIAGSIRRKKPEVKDIEIVAIPKEYENGLFRSGLAEVVEEWQKIKGELDYKTCRYTQRLLPEGIVLDLFFAHRDNWGLIYAIRTGSADYSHHVLAAGWVKHGFYSKNGMLCRHASPRNYPVPEEIDLFNLIRLPYAEPEHRNL